MIAKIKKMHELTIAAAEPHERTILVNTLNKIITYLAKSFFIFVCR